MDIALNNITSLSTRSIIKKIRDKEIKFVLCLSNIFEFVKHNQIYSTNVERSKIRLEFFTALAGPCRQKILHIRFQRG